MVVKGVFAFMVVLVSGFEDSVGRFALSCRPSPKPSAVESTLEDLHPGKS